MSQVSNDEVLGFEPNCALKKVLGAGFKIEPSIGEEEVAACEGIISKAVQEFFDRGVADVVALEVLVEEMEAMSDEELFLKAGTYAHNLRGQSEILGFTLVTSISKQMIDSIDHTELSEQKKKQLIARITEVLRVAFDQKIQDAGGAKGQELLALLEHYLSTYKRDAVA